MIKSRTSTDRRAILMTSIGSPRFYQEHPGLRMDEKFSFPKETAFTKR